MPEMSVREIIKEVIKGYGDNIEGLCDIIPYPEDTVRILRNDTIDAILSLILEEIAKCKPEEKDYSPDLVKLMVEDGHNSGFNNVFKRIRNNVLADFHEAIKKELK